MTQEVTWRNGTFRPRINVTQNPLIKDVWLMGSLTIPAATAQTPVAPVIAPVSDNYIVGGGGVNTTYRWTVIRVNGPITMNVTPTIQSDGPNYQRYGDIPRPGVTDWLLGVP